MKKNKQILFVLPTLTAGGAERILSFLSQNLNKSDFESHLLVIGKKSEAKFEVKKTKVTFLNKSRVLKGIPDIIFFLFKYKPDVVISSIGHLNTVLGLLSPFYPKSKFIIREASVISKIREFSSKKTRFGFLSKWAVKSVDAVVCQSKDMAIDFQNIYGLSKHRLHIINNPITKNEPPKVKSLPSKTLKLITIGRLSKEKGHSRVIKILNQLDRHFHYTIIGDGPEKRNLFGLIDDLNLRPQITYYPQTDDVYKHLRENDLFLQGSYVEGFPNATLESCLVGTPVLAFDVPGGTKEIISHEKNGFLVKTEKEFLKYLYSEIKLDPNDIHESIIAKFDQAKIIAQYEHLFKSI